MSTKHFNLFQQLPRIEGRTPEMQSIQFARWSLKFGKSAGGAPIATLFSAWSETAPYKMCGEFPIETSFAIAAHRYFEQVLRDAGVITDEPPVEQYAEAA